MSQTVVLNDQNAIKADENEIRLYFRGVATELMHDDRLVWDSKHNIVELVRRGEPLTLVRPTGQEMLKWPADQTGDIFGLGKAGEVLRMFKELALKAGFRLRQLTMPQPRTAKKRMTAAEQEKEKNAPVYVCFTLLKDDSSRR